MRNKKLLMIVIIIIAILVIGGTVFGYLILATDTFKSDKELFAKYMSQNIETFKEITDVKVDETYKQIMNQSKYESNTDIKIVHSEGGEVSNPINNLSVKMDVQKDDENQYFYADGQVLFGDEEYLELELIREQQLHGIRFTDVVRQFLTIRDDENLSEVASDLEIEKEQLIKFMDVIDGNMQIDEEILPKEKSNALVEKYTNMVKEAFLNGSFSSNKKAMITYNNNTITTKAYTLSLTSEQITNLLQQIVNSLKEEEIIQKYIYDNIFTNTDDSLETNLNEDDTQDMFDDLDNTVVSGENNLDMTFNPSDDTTASISDEIMNETYNDSMPEIKITIYVQDKNAIRTSIELGENKIVLENTKENGQIKANIQFSQIVNDQSNIFNIEISKQATETQEDISLVASVMIGEENYSISLLNKMLLNNDSVQSDLSLTYKQDILTVAFEINNEVYLGEFEKKQVLDEKNNLVLNDVEQERRISIIGQIKDRVPSKISERINLLEEALNINVNNEEENEQNNEEENEMSQVDINKFNAKFEFYSGDEVTSENVKTLLQAVKDNLGSYEIKPIESQEENETINQEEEKYTIKLNIEKDKTDEEGINQVLEKIEDNKKYKVSISYKESNNLIDYIIIQELER